MVPGMSGVDPEMMRGDVIVQVVACRKCLELPLACITLCESGAYPDVRFTAQRTNTFCVVCAQCFSNIREVLELLSMCYVNIFLCRESWSHRIRIFNRYFCLNNL